MQIPFFFIVLLGSEILLSLLIAVLFFKGELPETAKVGGGVTDEEIFKLRPQEKKKVRITKPSFVRGILIL